MAGLAHPVQPPLALDFDVDVVAMWVDLRMVLPWDMVDNSASPCEPISGWIFSHSTVQAGRFIL